MIKNFIGERFGRLVVLEDFGLRSKLGRVIWPCICDCGNLKMVNSKGLITESTKSCGCLRFNNINGYKHGDTGKKLYRIWDSMKRRCYDKNHHAYGTYGGRQITVCAEWKESYLAFKNWATSSGYIEGLSIDRKDNDGNYEPSNCQFITRSDHSKKSIKSRPENPVESRWKNHQYKLKLDRSKFYDITSV